MRPDREALQLLRRLPAWEHGVEKWMHDQRNTQRLNYYITKPIFMRWKRSTSKVPVPTEEGCAAVVIYAIAALDIAIILLHIFYPVILVYCALVDFSSASTPATSPSRI